MIVHGGMASFLAPLIFIGAAFLMFGLAYFAKVSHHHQKKSSGARRLAGFGVLLAAVGVAIPFLT